MTRPIPALLVAGEESLDLAAALNSETPRFRVKIASSLEAEELDRYKLIVLSHSDWPAAKARLARYLKRGGGLSLIHLPESGTVEPNSDYRVKIADPDHPAAREVVAFDTSDHFANAGIERPGIHVLATAQLKAGGPDRPVAFTQTYGKGRIFQTLLGADAAAIGIPGATQLIRYGSLWAAEK